MTPIEPTKEQKEALAIIEEADEAWNNIDKIQMQIQGLPYGTPKELRAARAEVLYKDLKSEIERYEALREKWNAFVDKHTKHDESETGAPEGGADKEGTSQKES